MPFFLPSPSPLSPYYDILCAISRKCSREGSERCSSPTSSAFPQGIADERIEQIVLVSILTGVIVLTALSVLGISIERREKRRFARAELSRLLERPASAGTAAQPELLQTRPDLSANTGRLSSVILDVHGDLNEELLEAEIARKKNPKRLQALKIKISPVFDCRIFSKSALPIAARGITRIDLSRLGLEIQFLASDVLLQ